MKVNDRRAIGEGTLLRAAGKMPMLSQEEEVALATQAQAGSEAAFEKLLKAHLRLVITIAHEFGKYGTPLEDLVSEGLLGLVEAARRFDPQRGTRLAAYAAWRIRAYMRRYTILNRRIIRAPSSRNGRTLLANLRRTQRDLAQKTGSQPDASQIATALGVNVSDVEEMEAALSGRDVSCEGELDGQGIQIASQAPNPEALVAEAESQHASQHAVQTAMARLPERERRILEERFFKEERGSLASIGRTLGLSRERVRQLQREAQTKMRRAIAVSPNAISDGNRAA